MIRTEKLSFAYDKELILDHVDFEAQAGQLVVVLGRNGAGKSTFFKCILGFLNRYTGNVFLEGKDSRTLSRREMTKIAAYIPQTEIPVYNYPVFDTVLMGTTGTLSPLQSPGAEQIATARQAVKSMGIEDLAERGINDISGGERQLALLARAIAQQAHLLIMDEPTANLDYGNQHLVMQTIKEMVGNGYTVLLSTHNPEHALLYATHVLALKDRKVYASGPADKVITEELLGDLYGMKVRIAETRIDGRTVRSCIPVDTVF